MRLNFFLISGIFIKCLRSQLAVHTNNWFVLILCIQWSFYSGNSHPQFGEISLNQLVVVLFFMSFRILVIQMLCFWTCLFLHFPHIFFAVFIPFALLVGRFFYALHPACEILFCYRVSESSVCSLGGPLVFNRISHFIRQCFLLSPGKEVFFFCLGGYFEFLFLTRPYSSSSPFPFVLFSIFPSRGFHQILNTLDVCLGLK